MRTTKLEHHPHRENRGDRDHAVGRGGSVAPLIPLMLVALFAMGIHSTFFGPIKYAILPQHLEASTRFWAARAWSRRATYSAILAGTIVGGIMVPQRADGSYHAELAAAGPYHRGLGRIAGSRFRLLRPSTTPKFPAFQTPAWTGTHPRLDPPGHRDDACARLVPGDPRDQLLLGAGGGPGGAIPAVVKTRWSGSARRDPVPVGLLGSCVALGLVVINRLLNGTPSPPALHRRRRS